MVENSKLYEKMGLYDSKRETSKDYFKKAFGNSTDEISTSSDVEGSQFNEDIKLKKDLFSMTRTEKDMDKVVEKSIEDFSELEKEESVEASHFNNQNEKKEKNEEKMDEKIKNHIDHPISSKNYLDNKEVTSYNSNKMSKDKVIDVSEIYQNKALESDEKKMIFVADSYLKAIPDNLSVGIQRETVHKIMSVSGLSVEYLLDDARQRNLVLNEVQENTEALTKSIISENEGHIDDLMNQIEALETIIEDRKKLQLKQNKIIDAEKKKIKHIVDFIKPKAE